MEPLWAAVRDRLERQGFDRRGRLTVPALDAEGRRTLTSLLGVQRSPARLELDRLEAALVRLGVGTDLLSGLGALGFAPSEEPARRRASRARGEAAREAARRAVTGWPEPWGTAWINDIIRVGVLRDLAADEAEALVADVRRVIDELDRRVGAGSESVARVDLAAQVLGDAHRLDTGRRLEAAVRRALRHRLGPIEDDRGTWDSAGVHVDLTSGPVLTWRLPVEGGLADLVRAATVARVPVHLTRLALQQHPIRVPAGTNVLIVENPRVVEAAAQRGVDRAVVSAGGSPSGAVQLLVRQLLDAGATIRYHGDFDAAGLALCARMHALGVTPWRMTARDYGKALAQADADGVTLPIDPDRSPPTPWDRDLSDLFDAERRIVHEERLLDDLLS